MEERPKRNWREIDRMRDGSSRGKRAKCEKKDTLERALEDPRVKKKYLREAERLFLGAKGRPEHARDIRSIHESYGTSGFGAAVKHYLETYGMPNDWATLMLLLDLKGDIPTVISALDALVGLADQKGPVERKGLRSKIDIMRITARDPEIRDAAEDAYDSLNP